MTQIGIIDAAEFVKRIQDNNDIQVLDIRSDLEYCALCLDYALTHIPLDKIELDDHPRSDNDVYILCKMGPRAFKLAEALAQRGHENLVVIDGGIIGCAQSGANVEQSKNQPTPEEIIAAVQDSFQKFMMKNS